MEKILIYTLLVIFVIGITQTAQASSVIETIKVVTYPIGVAYDSGKGEIFVTNTDTNSVSVINDKTNKVVATIPVGKNPLGVAYNSAKGEIYVTNFGSNTVSVISDKTNKVVATIDVGRNPIGIAYDSGTGEVYVANRGTTNIANWNNTPMINRTDSTISVINDKTHKVVETIKVENTPIGLAYDSGKGEIFVANFGYGIIPKSTIHDDNTVSIINDKTHKVVETIHLGNILVAEIGIDTEYSSLLGVGNAVIGIAYDSGTGEVYVANRYDDVVYVISDETNTVVTKIKVGRNPIGIAYDSGTGEIFVANSGKESRMSSSSASNTVSVINDKTHKIVETIKVEMAPLGVAYDSGKGEIFVTNFDSKTVSVIVDGSPNGLKTISEKKASDGKTRKQTVEDKKLDKTVDAKKLEEAKTLVNKKLDEAKKLSDKTLADKKAADAKKLEEAKKIIAARKAAEAKK